MTNEAVAQFFRELPVNIADNPYLRDPQKEGYQAAVEYFREHSSHAVIQIPVGCGKSGLMGLLPFRIAKGRVLIITPNLEIRKGVHDELNVTSPDCFYKKTNVINDLDQGPFVAVLDKDANISDAHNAHIVITNIHQLASSADRWLPQFANDFFDLILVDEGHHNAATSWQKVFERFPSAKVVSLTATPYRADGQEVRGDVVYRYSFADAMRKGYIKQLTAVNVAPSEIYFVYKGDEQHHTLDEVLELREEEWFRKGVALSRETNISIVDASIQCLRGMRQNGTQHQIIAVACSVDHAREIASLYQERDYPAAAIHSQMSTDDRETVLRDLRAGRINCIVQVQMLGEGFNHPLLSVAAIFRPFQSLSPYVQFVGRAMRVIQQNSPGHPDNDGYVVSHIGLQQDERWNDFKLFDASDQRLFENMVENISNQVPTDDTVTRRPRLRPDMVVVGQVIDRFLTDGFLDPNDDAALDAALDEIGRMLGVEPEALGMSREDLARRLQSVRQGRTPATPERIPVQPQRLRQGRRTRLNEQTRSVAGRMLSALHLSPQALDLVRLYPGTGANNFAVAIRLMHKQINQLMGFEVDSRSELEIEQLESAISKIDEAGDLVQEMIEKKRGGANG